MYAFASQLEMRAPRSYTIDAYQAFRSVLKLMLLGGLYEDGFFSLERSGAFLKADAELRP
jgi:hypothetical protein